MPQNNKKPRIKLRVHDRTAHHFADHCQAPYSNLYGPPVWVTAPVYILGMMFCGVKDFFVQFASLVLILPNFFSVPSHCQGMRH